MATYTVEPYERGGQTLTGYAAEYARALDAEASNSQAHQQANYQAGGTGITAAEMDKYGQTGYTVNPNTGYVASQYDAQSDAWRAEDARREAERQRQLELERLKQAQIAANMAQLDKSKGASLSAIAQEQSAVDPRFYEAKRQTQEQSALARRQAEEYAAAKGLSSSGLAAQSQSTISGGLQSALGSLGQSQAEAHAKMERAKSDLEAAYQSDVAGVQAGAEAQYLQNVIDQYYKDREYQLAKEQSDRQFALQEAGLTGYYQGQLTAAGQQAQQALEMGNIELAMAKLKQEALPKELELHLSDIETKLANNELDRQTAMINLEDLINPSGVFQTSMKLQSLMNNLQIETLPEQTRIQLATAQANLNSINQSVLSSRADVEYKNAQLEKISADLSAIQSGGYDTGTVSYDPKTVEQELLNIDPVRRLYLLKVYGDPQIVDGEPFEGYKNIFNMPKYLSLISKANEEIEDSQEIGGMPTSYYTIPELDTLGQMWPQDRLLSQMPLANIGR